ncbi:MAG TPA: copper homeostasis protein CutC [Candidatus Sulfotelmatobacter sp.]|jgi:copper homeostasis protein
MNSPIVVEICVDSTASAVAAERGGAHRIELCSGLAEGGITPSAGLIENVRRHVRIPVHVIIRPRGGDFFYTDDEFETMKRDVLTAKQLGADGIVLGILQDNGTVDTPRTRCLVEVARPLAVTFHRAFDMTSDLQRALAEITSAGVDRILTSGGAQNAENGLPTIAGLVANAKDNIVIMVGGGIRETNVQHIVAATGARDVHANVAQSVPSPMRFRNEAISLGAIKGCEYQRLIVPEESVRKLVEASAGCA